MPLPDIQSNRNIRCVYQDDQGTIWIASNGGLYLYDGVEVVRYAPSTDKTMPMSETTNVLEDDRGFLWVSTAIGPLALTPKRDSTVFLSHIGIADSLWRAKNFSFCQGVEKEVLVLSGGSLYSYSSGRLTRKQQIPYTAVAGKPWELFYSLRDKSLYFCNQKGSARFYMLQSDGHLHTRLPIKGTNGWEYYDDMGKPSKTLSRAFSDSVTILLDAGTWHLLQYNHGQKAYIMGRHTTLDSVSPLFRVVKRKIEETMAPPEGIKSVFNYRFFYLPTGIWAVSSSVGLFLVSNLDSLPYLNTHATGWGPSNRQYAFFTFVGSSPASARYAIVKNGDEVSIGQGTQMVEVAFRVANPFYSEVLQFRYRIPGSIDAWQYLGYEDKALFLRPSAGKYKVEIQTKMHGGQWNTAYFYTLSILPRWHETKWIKLGLVLLLAGLSYGLYRMRIAYLRDEVGLQQQISADLHDYFDENIRSLDDLSRRIAASPLDTIDRQQYLRKFEAVSRDTFKSIRIFIWAFDPKLDTLSSLFDKLEDFAEDYLSSLVPHVQVDRADTTSRHKIGPRTKYQLVHIYQDLLRDITQHTYSQSIYIQLRLSGRHLMICIQNEYEGYKPDVPHTCPEMSKTRLHAIGAVLQLEDPNPHLQVVKVLIKI